MIVSWVLEDRISVLFLKGFAEEIFHTNDLKAQEIFKDDFVLVKVDLLQIHYKRKKVNLFFKS